MIAFSVSRLEKEDIRLEGMEPPDFLVLAGSEPFEVDSPMSYRLMVSRVSGGALVSGGCAVSITGSCGRCLSAISRRVETENFSFFVEISPHTEVCDISEEIRTEMTLALPMNLLCRDNCLGLCPICGVDRNQHPCSCKPEALRGPGVWDALDNLELH